MAFPKKSKFNKPGPNVRTIAEGNAIARASGGVSPTKAVFKQSEVTNAQGNKVISTQPVSAGGSQFDTLAEANKTKAGTTDRQMIQKELDREKLKKQMEAEQMVANVTPEQLARLNQLSTEQNIFANPQENEMPTGNPNVEDVLRTAGERAAIGFTGGLATGALGGAAIGGIPTLGLGAVPGAIIGAVAVGTTAGIIGGVSGLFAEYNQQSANDITSVQNNFKTAKDIIDTSIMSANRPGGNPNQLIQDFTDAEAAMMRAHTQMQYISTHDKRGDEKATLQKIEMEKYINTILPQMKIRMENSLRKPDPTYMQQYNQPIQ